jgi:hypothetical protein
MQLICPEWERPDLTPAERREAFMAAVREAQKPDPITGQIPSARQIARKLNVKVAAVRACKAYADHVWI